MTPTYVTLVAMVAAAVFAALGCGHADTLTLSIVTVFLFPIAGIFVWRARVAVRHLPTRRSGTAKPRSPIARCILLGILFGLLAAGIAIPVSNAIASMPIVRDLLLDLDQYRVYAQVDRAEKERAWVRAAQILENRSKRPASTRWRNAMSARAYADLLEAITSANTPTSQRMVRQYCDQLTPQLGAPRNAHQALFELNDEIANVQFTFTKQLSKMKQDAQDTTRKLARNWFHAILKHAEVHTLSFHARQTLYNQAEQIAAQYELDPAEAARQLANLESQRRVAAPCNLPENASVQVTATWLDVTLPVALLNIRLHDALGVPILHLTPKDVRLSLNDADIPILGFEYRPAVAARLQLAVLLDASNSTAGNPLEQAKGGIQHIAADLGPRADIKTFTFADDVQSIHDWTNSPDTIQAALAPVVSNGGTGLYLGLQHALEQLVERPPPHAILVFTDGDDTVGLPTEDEIITRLRNAHIPVFAAGLVTTELNQQVLIRIAKATGGMFLPVSDASKISETLHKLANNINADAYRLIITLPSHDTTRISLHIGAENAVTCDVSLPEATLPSAHHTVAP